MINAIPPWLWLGATLAGLFALVYALTASSRGRTKARTSERTPPAEIDAPSVGAPSSRRLVVVKDALAPVSSDGSATEGVATSATDGPLPRLEFDDDESSELTTVGAAAAAHALDGMDAAAQKILFDDDAVDETTHTRELILVTGTSQSDKGLRRQRNEDAILMMPDQGVFAVADGMGGHRGGEIASHLAVDTIKQAFRAEGLEAPSQEGIPRRASELARAIQMANAAILRRVSVDRELDGMGTTVCAARFSSNKQRLYIGHVGDSRMYRLREGRMVQLTADHTMRDLGVVGEGAGHLSRAVGIWPSVPIDVVLCKPRPDDLYLLCSDGLTKMVDDQQIGRLMDPAKPPARIVEALIDAANANGGNDNISAIVIRVDDAARTRRPASAHEGGAPC